MTTKLAPILAIVAPCYNEQEALAFTTKAFVEFLEKQIHKGNIHPESYMYLVDDGSQDATWDQILKSYQKNPGRIKGLKLSVNVGHQHALYAGLMAQLGRVDCVVSIDADLQDDINVIEEMLREFRAGRDVVYGVRKSRDTDSWFKKYSALTFYKMIPNEE